MPRMTATKSMARPSAPVSTKRARSRKAAMPDRLSARTLFFRRVRKSLKPGLWILAGLVVLALLPGLFRSVESVKPVAASSGAARHGLATLAAYAGFRVQKIEVTGADTTPMPLILAAIGAQKGTPIFAYPLADIQTRVEQLGPVQSATVERALPGTLIVNINERSSFAIWQQTTGGATKFVLIDKQGNVITDQDAVAAKRHDPSLLLLAGADAPQNAATLIAELKTVPQLFARVVAAERVDGLRWNLTLKDNAVVKLPVENEAHAMGQLAQLQASMGLLDRPVEVIDMRLPDRLVVRPYGASTTSTNSSHT